MKDKNQTDKFALAKQLAVVASQYRNLLNISGQASFIKDNPYLKVTNLLLKEKGFSFLEVGIN